MSASEQTAYYRRFVRNSATIAAPLSDLLKEPDQILRTKKKRLISWTTACQHASVLLKAALYSEPVLTEPDWRCPFVIKTDASEWAIGCARL
jgi:hypothetical protein